MESGPASHSLRPRTRGARTATVFTVPDANETENFWWVKDLNLYESNCDRLFCGLELTDNIVNAAQRILAKQFPEISGFQDTFNAHKLTFKSVPQLVLSLENPST